MTLFSIFTYPEGKGLDAGKVITTPPGLLDFNLGHYPVCVCDYFPLWRPEPQCKGRQQRILTLVLCRQGEAESTLQGAPEDAGVRRLHFSPGGIQSLNPKVTFH